MIEPLISCFWRRGTQKGCICKDSVTGGFSGADLEGLVRYAGSIALSRARGEGAGIDTLVITLDDVKQALCNRDYSLV